MSPPKLELQTSKVHLCFILSSFFFFFFFFFLKKICKARPPPNLEFHDSRISLHFQLDFEKDFSWSKATSKTEFQYLKRFLSNSLLDFRTNLAGTTPPPKLDFHDSKISPLIPNWSLQGIYIKQNHPPPKTRIPGFQDSSLDPNWNLKGNHIKQRHLPNWNSSIPRCLFDSELYFKKEYIKSNAPTFKTRSPRLQDSSLFPDWILKNSAEAKPPPKLEFLDSKITLCFLRGVEKEFAVIPNWF